MSALISDLKLLDDQDIQRFIMDGMLSFLPDISSETHEEIHSLLSNCYENESPLGNNVLSRIPQMHKVLRSREVDGAITSILGKNYLLHPHRAVHRSTPVASDSSSFNIATDKITTIAHINDKIEGEYSRVFSKIEVPKKPSIIT